MRPGDLLETLRIVWQASPRHTLMYAATSLLSSALPAANLYVGKLLLDEVAQAAQGNVTYQALLTLLSFQVGLMVLGVLWVVVYYVTQGRYPVEAWGYYNVAAGMGFLLAGFLVATRWQ